MTKTLESGYAELLAQLVAFDTTSHKSNLDLVAFVEDYLRRCGVASDRVPSEDGAKASLFATIGPRDIGGIALSGHTDVVPVDGQVWDSDPFTLRMADGRYYGRGTSDMKGFLACVLAAVPDFIVGEPTSMHVVDAHKGPVRWHVEVGGRAAHSSMAPLGVNAIVYANQLIAEIERIAADLKVSTYNARFDPPYATLQVTRIEGGTASNIVPVSCSFCFDMRVLPGNDLGAVEQRLRDFAEAHCLPAMRAVAPEASITITRANSVPPFIADPASDVVALTLKLAEQNATHAVSYATEAGLFQAVDVASIVCGPGDIAQAHTANEWIAIDELEKCMTFLKRLGDFAEA
jgi:acetylornithine deacetylase